VLAIDFLQDLLNTAKDHGLLDLPLVLPHNQYFPVVQYADDTVIFIKANARQLFFLKALLNSFAESTGLKVNFQKSIIPINVPDDKLEILSRTLGCAKGYLPFTYLGLPLSLTRPTVADYWPLVSRCERQLVSFSSFLSDAGRLQLTNAVFSALPTFAMSTFLLPKTVIKQIDKFQKYCLWRGNDINSRKPPKASWQMTCDTKQNGGLGVISLQTHNKSMLLKSLHKFFNKIDIPWVHLVWEMIYSNGTPPTGNKNGSFWWRDVLKLLPEFKGMAMATIRSGSSCFFWLDNWNGFSFSSMMPELFSFVKNKYFTVQQVVNLSEPQDLFHLPLSEEAFEQFTQLADII